MSDMIDMFRGLKDFRRLQREAFGVSCPVCIQKLPRAHPKVLLPGQTCRAHKPHYHDPRPELTQADIDTLAGAVMTATAPAFGSYRDVLARRGERQRPDGSAVWPLRSTDLPSHYGRLAPSSKE